MIGQQFIHLSEVDSTNNYTAKLIAADKLFDGAVILADKQLNGRGQRGNVWSSSSDNQYTASFYWQTAFLSATEHAFLNMAVAIAVMETLSDLGVSNSCIKWPNDILCKDKKVGGILLEAQWFNGQMKGIIIGVGINCTSEANLPSAIALDKLLEKAPSNVEIAQVMYSKLLKQRQLLEQKKFDEIVNVYHQNLWRKNVLQKVNIKEIGECEIEILRVNNQGDLIILLNNEERSMSLQEIQFNY